MTPSTVKVDDIDPNGKISLSPVDELAPKAGDGGDDAARGEAGNGYAPSSSSSEAPSGGSRTEVNFSDQFDAELKETFGDLGPAAVRSGGGGGRDRGDRDRGDRNRSGRGGSGGGGRSRRR